jgi:EmrB/QacA subfamily drug resistance transporter
MNRTRLVPLIVASALFIENADSAMVATALPTIAADLNVDPLSLKLALTAYLIALAMFIPISGWIADRAGARRTFVCAMLLFMLGSLASTLNTTLSGFVASRFVQGVGGAMMVPVGRLIILRNVPRHQLIDAMAYLTIPGLLGPLIGPPLAGFLTTYVDWRLIFAINIPTGLIGIAFAWRHFDDERPQEHARLDAVGFILTSLAAIGLMGGLASFGRHLVSTEIAVALLAGGLVAGAAYAAHARNHPAPLIDFSLFRVPTFRAGVLGGTLFRIGIGATPFLLPLLFQVAFGMDALQSGLITFTTAIGAISMKTLAARILRKFGYRLVVAWNAVLAGALVAFCAWFRPDTAMWVVIGLLIAGGFARSLQFTAVNTLSFADIPPERMSKATSLASTAQNVSQAMGIAFAAALLEASAARHGGALRDTDFTIGFVAAGSLAAFSGLLAWRLPADAGSGLVSPQPPSSGCVGTNGPPTTNLQSDTRCPAEAAVSTSGKRAKQP